MNTRGQTALEYLLLMVVVAALVVGLYVFMVPTAIDTAGTIEGGIGDFDDGGTTICSITCPNTDMCSASQIADATQDLTKECCDSTETCYMCDAGYLWDSGTGACVCTSDCTGKLCNQDDGCGTLCGCPNPTDTCDAAGNCVVTCSDSCSGIDSECKADSPNPADPNLVSDASVCCTAEEACYTCNPPLTWDYGSGACVANTYNVVAQKVVCDAEQYLPDWAGDGDGCIEGVPNWGTSGCHNVDANDAQKFVDASGGHCWFESGWVFQYGAMSSVSNPGDDATQAEAEAKGWTTVPPTDANGKIEFSVPESTHFFNFREVPKTGYVEFSGALYTGGDSVSAETACHNDVKNYDNYDELNGVTAGNTYYCIAFNAEEYVLEDHQECVGNSIYWIDSNGNPSTHVTDCVYDTYCGQVTPAWADPREGCVGTTKVYYNNVWHEGCRNDPTPHCAESVTTALVGGGPSMLYVHDYDCCSSDCGATSSCTTTTEECHTENRGMCSLSECCVSPPSSAPTVLVSDSNLECPGTFSFTWAGPPYNPNSGVDSFPMHYEARFNTATWTDVGIATSYTSPKMPAGTYNYDVRACNYLGCGPSASRTVEVLNNAGGTWSTADWSGTCQGYCVARGGDYYQIGYQHSLSSMPICDNNIQAWSSLSQYTSATECLGLNDVSGYYRAEGCMCKCN